MRILGNKVGMEVVAPQTELRHPSPSLSSSARPVSGRPGLEVLRCLGFVGQDQEIRRATIVRARTYMLAAARRHRPGCAHPISPSRFQQDQKQGETGQQGLHLSSGSPVGTEVRGSEAHPERPGFPQGTHRGSSRAPSCPQHSPALPGMPGGDGLLPQQRAPCPAQMSCVLGCNPRGEASLPHRAHSPPPVPQCPPGSPTPLLPERVPSSTHCCSLPPQGAWVQPGKRLLFNTRSTVANFVEPELMVFASGEKLNLRQMSSEVSPGARRAAFS